MQSFSKVLCLATLVACNQIYGLDRTALAVDAAPDQAIDGPGCSDGMFSGPVILDSLGVTQRMSLATDRRR